MSVFWAVALCDIVGYRLFGGTYCAIFRTPKLWCLPTSPHGVTTYETTMDSQNLKCHTCVLSADFLEDPCFDNWCSIKWQWDIFSLLKQAGMSVFSDYGEHHSERCEHVTYNQCKLQHYKRHISLLLIAICFCEHLGSLEPPVSFGSDHIATGSKRPVLFSLHQVKEILPLEMPAQAFLGTSNPSWNNFFQELA
jgi:hypothetical protein